MASIPPFASRLARQSARDASSHDSCSQLATLSLHGRCSCCTAAGGNKGLFTSTNPELRRVVPDNVAGRVKVKVVYTVLEAQYQSALSAGEPEGLHKGRMHRSAER
jgi:hypothetical protein